MAKRRKQKLSPEIEKLARHICRLEGMTEGHIDAQIEHWNNSKDDVIVLLSSTENCYIPEQLKLN